MPVFSFTRREATFLVSPSAYTRCASKCSPRSHWHQPSTPLQARSGALDVGRDSRCIPLRIASCHLRSSDRTHRTARTPGLMRSDECAPNRQAVRAPCPTVDHTRPGTLAYRPTRRYLLAILETGG